MTPLETFLHNYGIYAGLLVYVLLKDFIPFLRDQFWPNFVKKEDQARHALEIKMKEDIEERAEDRRFRRQVERERAEDLRTIRDAISSIDTNIALLGSSNRQIVTSESLIIDNQRRIMDKQDTHHNATMAAVTEMEREVARRHGIEQGRLKLTTGSLKPVDKEEE